MKTPITQEHARQILREYPDADLSEFHIEGGACADDIAREMKEISVAYFNKLADVAQEMLDADSERAGVTRESFKKAQDAVSEFIRAKVGDVKMAEGPPQDADMVVSISNDREENEFDVKIIVLKERNQ